MRCTYYLFILLAMVCATPLVASLISVLSLPVVYESYSTGACVRVDDPAGEYSCEKMPPRYAHEWVR